MRTQAAARKMKASAVDAWRSWSLASRRLRPIQAKVRWTNACTVLPTRAFAGGRRGPARSVRRRNPENHLNCVTVDFDAAHENADDFLHAGVIETVEAIGDLGREVLQAVDHERKVALGLDGV